MSARSFSITEGRAANPSLGFIARTLQVDNLSSSWLYIEGASRYVPPWQWGVVTAIDGTDAPALAWQTPAALIANPTPTTPGTAYVTAFTTQQPQSNGFSVYQQGPSAANVLTGSAGATGATIITIPAGRIWQGSLGLSIVAAAAEAEMSIVPDAGSLVPLPNTQLLALEVPAAQYDSLSIGGVLVVAQPSSVCHLTIASTGPADATYKLATASGSLL